MHCTVSLWNFITKKTEKKNSTHWTDIGTQRERESMGESYKPKNGRQTKRVGTNFWLKRLKKSQPKDDWRLNEKKKTIKSRRKFSDSASTSWRNLFLMIRENRRKFGFKWPMTFSVGAFTLHDHLGFIKCINLIFELISFSFSFSFFFLFLVHFHELSWDFMLNKHLVICSPRLCPIDKRYSGCIDICASLISVEQRTMSEILIAFGVFGFHGSCASHSKLVELPATGM